MKNKSLGRRKFLHNSLSAGAALALSSRVATAADSEKSAEAKTTGPLLSDSSKRFMELVNIKYPIIQAPAGGTASPELLKAVSDKGGFGSMALTWKQPDDGYKIVKDLLASTQGSFFINYALHFPPKSLDKTIEAGAKIIQFSLGMPTPEMVKKVKDAGIIMGLQVTSESSAQMALDLGADYMVCQGMEAGGHVQATRFLADALERVLSVAGDVPVAASGGIATGQDMAKYMNMGAAAVVMGSRFLASHESAAHDVYKDELLKAKAEDTVYTICFNKRWPNAPHRVIRNETFERWEAAGCPIKDAPGSDDVIAEFPHRTITRYEAPSPLKNMYMDPQKAALYAGTGVSNINEVLGAAEIIDRVWAEYQQAQQAG